MHPFLSLPPPSFLPRCFVSSPPPRFSFPPPFHTPPPPLHRRNAHASTRTPPTVRRSAAGPTAFLRSLRASLTLFTIHAVLSSCFVATEEFFSSLPSLPACQNVFAGHRSRCASPSPEERCATREHDSRALCPLFVPRRCARACFLAACGLSRVFTGCCFASMSVVCVRVLFVLSLRVSLSLSPLPRTVPPGTTRECGSGSP